MKFDFAAPVAVAPARAIAAYASPSFYESRENIAVLGAAEKGGTLEVHYRFDGNVSGAVRRVVDPAKLSWLTQMHVMTDQLRVEWDIVPDNYADRLSSSGHYVFDADGGENTTLVRVGGELSVHVPLVGRSVERAIVTGLRSYIEAEVASIPEFADGAG